VWACCVATVSESLQKQVSDMYLIYPCVGKEAWHGGPLTIPSRSIFLQVSARECIKFYSYSEFETNTDAC